MKEPCLDCKVKILDEWGYFCETYCGKRVAYLNYQAGIREVVKWIRSHTLIEPDKDSITRFEPFYQIEEKELKEWGIEEK